MERLYSNVGSLQGTFKETPKVLQTVRVHSAVNVPLCMVNDLVHEILREYVIGWVLIGINLRAALHVLENSALQHIATDVRNNAATNLAQFAVKHSVHGSLTHVDVAAITLSLDLAEAFFLVLVHELAASADKGFVALYFTGRAA